MSRRLYSTLQVAGHRVRALADGHTKSELGVTAAQLGILMMVHRSPGCTQREVSEALQIRESGLTAATARLDALSLLRRERRDGRSLALWLTEEGERIVDRGHPLVRMLEERLAEDFSDEELLVVERFLHTAIERFREL